MREIRNTILVVLLFALGGWAFYAWFMVEEPTPGRMTQQGVSLILLAGCGISIIWAFHFEDKLPDQLSSLTGGIYYERDGICFMPVMRKTEERAFLCLYYANRYDSPCNVIVHLRPPAESIQHRPDAYDIHFAFACPPGAVGVLSQPVAVHPKLQGQVVDVQLAAAVNYPHNRGTQLRSKRGIPCGTFDVDWGENFRTGSHELSGELELIDPVTIHLAIPRNVSNRIRKDQHWQHEIIFAGTSA